MDEKYSNGGEAEVITKLVMTTVSRKNPRWLTVLSGFFLLLVVPCTWAAQDLSDMKLKAEQGDAATQVQLGFTYEHGKGVPQGLQGGSRVVSKGCQTRQCPSSEQSGRHVP